MQDIDCYKSINGNVFENINDCITDDIDAMATQLDELLKYLGVDLSESYRIDCIVKGLNNMKHLKASIDKVHSVFKQYDEDVHNAHEIRAYVIRGMRQYEKK